MSLPTLITLQEALYEIPNAKLSDYPKINFLIEAASDIVQNYCRRIFPQATYDELYTVQGSTSSLFVKNPPVTQINNLRSGKLPAMYILWRDPLNQTQQASVNVTTSAVVLTLIYNNVTTVNTFTFAEYPTFTSLSNAINALNTNWTTTLTNQFAIWQTSDLIVGGAWNARNVNVGLTPYWWGIVYELQNQELGEIYLTGGALPGYQTYRIQYVGGFATIPPEIKNATACLVNLMYQQSMTNPLMSSETLDKYTYTKSAQMNLDNLGLAAKLTLNNYKLMRVGRWQ